MKKKPSMFSQSYKVGISIFIGLSLIVSFILFTIFRSIDGVSFKKEKLETEESYDIENDIPDTVKVSVEKVVTVVDTFYVQCKKNHCDELHTPKKDTLK